MKKILEYKCVVWGIGNDYENLVNQIQFEVAKGNIIITALVARSQDIVEKTLDGIIIVTKEEMKDMTFDYLIVTSSLYFQRIVEEAKELNISEDKIINGSVMKLPFFDFRRYVSLVENRITILSDDCWGGYIYHKLFMKFYSPCINIKWQKDSFVKFIQKPRYYLSQPLRMEREGDIRGNLFPIGSLGEGEEKVYMDLVHSVCFEDAKKLWDKRLERVNFENFFIKLGIDASDKNRDFYLDGFDQVKQKKICFYSGETESKSVIYLKRFEKFVTTGSRMDTIKYHDYCRDLDWLLKSIDILKLLNGKENFLREGRHVS